MRQHFEMIRIFNKIGQYFVIRCQEIFLVYLDKMSIKFTMKCWYFKFMAICFKVCKRCQDQACIIKVRFIG